MAFVVAQRVTRVTGSGRSLLRAGRRLTDRLRAARNLTAERRADRYVTRMPIAVITASLGGHPTPGPPRP
ncbi:hypothetical protein H7H78_00495 [Mycobacterium shinjukuense]|uniref:Uncharacterized protein n=1 Tax=Mycobacterium shinjukuense TaxID=398694 RepID=A0A7I7MX49_9MYCO|nr:hypothetical protein [Mycobacterium shinjukuense]MCV6983986.1 hypothetical protein [Mycobacterium shinjukuense]ORB65415.1 hypothetical protein BST45_15250 [Mycobacterium shinjukuense]BBX75749.1 hypothetical protein MSHI_36550 [Mycobacterium shinjukuense]